MLYVSVRGHDLCCRHDLSKWLTTVVSHKHKHKQLYYCSCTVFARVHLRGWVKLKGWHQFKLFTWQTHLNKIWLRKWVYSESFLLNIFQLTSTEAMSSYKDRSVKIEVVFHALYFENELKSVTPQLFCISDIGNSLPDCNQTMKKICVVEVFRANFLK